MMMTFPRKTLLSLIAASAVSMTSLAFAQTNPAPTPPPASTMPQDAAMQGAAAPAPAPMAAPTASADTPKSWKDLDANKDGKLTKDEVAGDATWTADFDSADTNKDGSISKAEFKKHNADTKKVASNIK